MHSEVFYLHLAKHEIAALTGETVRYLQSLRGYVVDRQLMIVFLACTDKHSYLLVVDAGSRVRVVLGPGGYAMVNLDLENLVGYAIPPGGGPAVKTVWGASPWTQVPEEGGNET